MLKHRLANASGISALSAQWNRRRPLVVTYHGIYDGPKRPEDFPPTFVHIEDFRTQIAFLSHRYHVLMPEYFSETISAKRAFPCHSALITFDDGYESYGRLAENVLAAHSLRAVVFLATEYIEERKPFWYDKVWFLLQSENCRSAHGKLDSLGFPGEERKVSSPLLRCLGTLKWMQPDARAARVEELAAAFRKGYEVFKKSAVFFEGMTPETVRASSQAGTTFGGHGHSHTILSVLSPGSAAEEISRNKRAIETMVSQPCDLFAYPNGNSQDFGPEHKKLLQQVGYRAAFCLTQNRSNPCADPYSISRYNVAPEDDLESLAFRFSGINYFWT